MSQLVGNPKWLISSLQLVELKLNSTVKRPATAHERVNLIRFFELPPHMQTGGKGKKIFPTSSFKAVLLHEI